MTRGGWLERDMVVGRGRLGEENQVENAFSFCIRSMNGIPNRRTWQVGGEAQCAILLFK